MPVPFAKLPLTQVVGLVRCPIYTKGCPAAITKAVKASAGAVTLRVLVALVPPILAVTLTELPTATAFTSPLLFTAASVEFDDTHVTLDVKSAVVLSVYFPVAVNCWVVPVLMLAAAGVTLMEANCLVAVAVTVSAALPDTPLAAAVIAVEPAATEVA